MKGWLDKYNDGGPVQPNYNDASASYSPNFVGDGYSNVGRNYSPAWGGQFEDGGKLPQFQPGGSTQLANVNVKSKKKEPVYVTDKNDPRLRAYNDSLSLYNISKDAETKLGKITANAYKKSGFDKSSVDKALFEGKDIVLHPEKYLGKGSFDFLKKYNKKGLYYESEPDREYLGTPQSPATIKDLIKYNKQDIKDRTPYINSLDEDVNGHTHRDRIEGAKVISDALQKEYEIVKRTGYNPTYFIPNAERSPNLIFKKPTQPVVYQERTYQTETPELQPLSIQGMDASLPELQRVEGPSKWMRSFGNGANQNYWSKVDAYGMPLPGYVAPNQNAVAQPQGPGPEFVDGGEIAQTGKTVPFDQWYKTVPKTKNDTINYNLRRAYELAPQKELDAFVKNPKAHLMSVYEDPNTGIYEFMKSKNHSTIQKELDFYNSKKGTDFRNSYDLDTTNDFYRYVPKKEMAMGGSMPGAVGFTYARTNDPAPSNGPYAKKTKASAQNGKEMQYYQNGLDFKPKTISRNGSVIKDDMGQWNHPGEITEIGSNQITMQGVPYPVMGISDTGDTQMMYPNQEYQYNGESVTEYPMMAQGGQLTKLDQLTNFTNYNTKQPGGWLDKYQ